MESIVGIGPLGLLGPVPLFALGLVAVAACGHWKHRHRHGHHPRCGGFGWWWIPALVIAIVCIRHRAPWHDGPHPRHVKVAIDREPLEEKADPDELDLPEGARLLPRYEIKLDPLRCSVRGVGAADLAVGVLTIVDQLAQWQIDAVRGGYPNARGPQLRDLEKTLLPARKRTVELREVARMSRRQGAADRGAAVRTVVVTVSRPRRGPKRVEPVDSPLLRRLGEELDAVNETRRQAGQAAFVLDRGVETLVIELSRDEEDYVAAPALPAPSQPPRAAGPPAPPIKTADEKGGASPGVADSLIRLALAWARGNDGMEIAQSIIESKRSAAIAKAKAIAESAASNNPAIASAKEAIEKAIDQERAKPPAPADTASNATGRPTWVDAPPPQRFDSRGKFVITGSTGPFYATPQESLKALPEVLTEMTRNYLDLLLGSEEAAKIDVANIRKTPVTWTGRVENGSGFPYYETHAMLEFNEDDHRAFLRYLRQLKSQRQAIYAAVGGVAVLALLATALGYLKLDTMTRGYYSGRLKLAAGTIGLVVLALTALVFSGEIRL